MTEKMTSQLTSYLDQIQEKYTNTETTTIVLEVNPQVQPILSAGPDNLAKIASRRKLQSLPVPCTRKPSIGCLVQMDRIIEIKDKNDLLPDYSGITYLYSGHVMLADYENSRVCLLDSSYNSITSYKLPSRTVDVCVVDDDDEVAVTMPYMKTVQFLSTRDGKITPNRNITTRYSCHGVAAAGKGKIIISGVCNDGGEPYWSLISSGGKEEFCRKFDCQCNHSWTHVAVDSSFTRVYITANLAHSLYCFDMSGIQKFVYCNDSLKMPRGIATDRYDYVYVVGYDSNNIHQLTPDGVVLQIITAGPLVKPQAICVSRDGDEILVTNDSEGKLYQYRLK